MIALVLTVIACAAGIIGGALWLSAKDDVERGMSNALARLRMSWETLFKIAVAGLIALLVARWVMVS